MTFGDLYAYGANILMFIAIIALENRFSGSRITFGKAVFFSVLWPILILLIAYRAGTLAWNRVCRIETKR